MYSKTRGGTPSRYRLNEDDFKELDFPLADKKQRETKAQEFEKSLSDYYKTIQIAGKELVESHEKLENDL